jgi:CDP-2,3-bis-(O-geranylgeranyl)-sn-glycerol synthase
MFDGVQKTKDSDGPFPVARLRERAASSRTKSLENAAQDGQAPVLPRRAHRTNHVIDSQQLFAALYFFVPAYLANMAPVLVQGRFRALAVPLDGGLQLRDRRVLGDHKTWRGLVAGVFTGIAVYEIQRIAYELGLWHSISLLDYGAYPLIPGFLLGVGTGMGDAVKSFFKRQIGIAPGASWFPFDQLDFLAGAYLAALPFQTPSLAATIACAPFVLAGGIATSAIGYRMGLKEAWI